MRSFLCLALLGCAGSCKHVCPTPQDSTVRVDVGADATVESLSIDMRARYTAACLATPNAPFRGMTMYGPVVVPTNYIDLANEGNNIEGRAVGAPSDLRNIRTSAAEECNRRLAERAQLLMSNGLNIMPPFPSCTTACSDSCRE